MALNPPNDRNYKVIFKPECLNHLEEFGTLEDLDLALSAVVRNLEKNPHTFKSVPEYPNWIVANTRMHPNRAGTKIIPSLKLYAFINDEKRLVIIVDARFNPNNPIMYM